ncbi:hypothetical protein EYF80_010295 [Liparis tanakae]|uniref:Uncharacterized protein n=1 Tax=Liparis tanakae TaxID=230148 RepID=A0A4Z2INT1_9TELE|nr:hypothetical protein EYF80_010295 [Liparis tanakae]
MFPIRRHSPSNLHVLVSHKNRMMEYMRRLFCGLYWRHKQKKFLLFVISMMAVVNRAYYVNLQSPRCGPTSKGVTFDLRVDESWKQMADSPQTTAS